jgi:galactokinase
LQGTFAEERYADRRQEVRSALRMLEEEKGSLADQISSQEELNR